MAPYTDVNYGQMTLVPVSFARQMRPGSFEYALHDRSDHELDLSLFEARFCHDEVGAPAYAPAVRLKIVLLAYSKALMSSRAIAGPAKRTCCSWRSQATVSRTSRRLPSS